MKITLSLVAWVVFGWVMVHTAGWHCAVGVLIVALLVKIVGTSPRIAA